MLFVIIAIIALVVVVGVTGMIVFRSKTIQCPPDFTPYGDGKCCSNNGGTIVDGKCTCKKGFSGEQCNQPFKCPPGSTFVFNSTDGNFCCSDEGGTVGKDGDKCECKETWYGPKCNFKCANGYKYYIDNADQNRCCYEQGGDIGNDPKGGKQCSCKWGKTDTGKLIRKWKGPECDQPVEW